MVLGSLSRAQAAVKLGSANPQDSAYSCNAMRNFFLALEIRDLTVPRGSCNSRAIS